MGIITTQRVESIHLAIKHSIRTRGSLQSACVKIDRWICCKKEKHKRDNLLIAAHKMYLELLYGKISFFAIAKLKEEFLRHDINPSILADNCDGCTTSIHFNLPCCHKLHINEPISVTVIPRHWRLHPKEMVDEEDVNLEYLSVTSNNIEPCITHGRFDDECKIKGRSIKALYPLEQRILNGDDEEQSCILAALNDILEEDSVDLDDILFGDKVATKGRNKKMKRLPTRTEIEQKKIMEQEKEEKKKECRS
ncbi:hypothetical protein BDC45DRAFT_565356 [Circinella umbellata]|nr:hypothetical protein BDC45DRAFT_565356 [Circinella umbellata]